MQYGKILVKFTTFQVSVEIYVSLMYMYMYLWMNNKRLDVYTCTQCTHNITTYICMYTYTCTCTGLTIISLMSFCNRWPRGSRKLALEFKSYMCTCTCIIMLKCKLYKYFTGDQVALKLHINLHGYTVHVHVHTMQLSFVQDDLWIANTVDSGCYIVSTCTYDSKWLCA